MPKSSFGFDQPEESPGFLLWQISVTWQRKIKAKLDPYGISHPQFVILAVLLWCEETKIIPIQSFLVNKTKLDKMTVSASLKKLASKNLIQRSEYDKDTRAKSVFLTSEGRRLTQQLVKMVEDTDAAFFSSIKANDRQMLISILSTLAENL